jgi:hypothetical protein
MSPVDELFKDEKSQQAAEYPEGNFRAKALHLKCFRQQVKEGTTKKRAHRKADEHQQHALQAGNTHAEGGQSGQ